MIERIIEFSARNRFAVIIAYLVVLGFGIWGLLTKEKRTLFVQTCQTFVTYCGDVTVELVNLSPATAIPPFSYILTTIW